MMLANIQRISVDNARELIWKECGEVAPNWSDSATWFTCILGVEDFTRLLVYNGGRPLSGWQEYSNGSYEIRDVAIGLRDYSGSTPDLVNGKSRVLGYERRMQAGEFPKALYLVGTGERGRITLFETNKRSGRTLPLLFHRA